MKKFLLPFILSALVLTTSGCIYRIDIPQGNFLETRKVEELRVEMTKEQVLYVVGTPVVKNMFDHETWIYLYHFKSGKGDINRKELRLTFEGDKLIDMSGDFEKHEDFNTPIGG